MKNRFLLTALFAFSLAGCESKTGSGALVGAGVGAAGGALITKSAGGALIGGAIGAAAGGLIGYALDEQDRASLQENSPHTLKKIDNQEPLSIDDIKEMSRNGLSDNTIIDQIKSTNSIFHLSADEIIDLKKSGVSERVIDYMIHTS